MPIIIISAYQHPQLGIGLPHMKPNSSPKPLLMLHTTVNFYVVGSTRHVEFLTGSLLLFKKLFIPLFGVQKLFILIAVLIRHIDVSFSKPAV